MDFRELTPAEKKKKTAALARYHKAYKSFLKPWLVKQAIILMALSNQALRTKTLREVLPYNSPGKESDALNAEGGLVDVGFVKKTKT